MQLAQAMASPGVDAPVVLVVEDDADTRQMIVRMLGSKYTVFVAPDGVTALDMLNDLTPMAIVLDVMMPRMDGLEVAKHLKAHSRLGGVPIIFLTAKNSLLDVVSGINAGARHYLSKPFAAADLLRKLEHLDSQSNQA